MKVVEAVIHSMNFMFDLLIKIACIIILTYGIYTVWDSWAAGKKASAQSYEQYWPDLEDGLGFNKLRQMNPEVFGWLKIEHTHIDYPLVQGEDNFKYVNTAATGEFALSGSLFLDYRNKKNFSDKNSIIYGHHMEKYKMFGELENFKKKKYFGNHELGAIYYEGSWHQIEIFAFLQTDAYDNFIYDINFGSQKTDTKCLNRIKKKSIYFRKLRWKKEEHFITLSTCMSDCTNGRYVLIGRIAQEESD